MTLLPKTFRNSLISTASLMLIATMAPAEEDRLEGAQYQVQDLEVLRSTLSELLDTVHEYSDLVLPYDLQLTASLDAAQEELDQYSLEHLNSLRAALNPDEIHLENARVALTESRPLFELLYQAPDSTSIGQSDWQAANASCDALIGSGHVSEALIIGANITYDITVGIKTEASSVCDQLADTELGGEGGHTSTACTVTDSLFLAAQAVRDKITSCSALYTARKAGVNPFSMIAAGSNQTAPMVSGDTLQASAPIDNPVPQGAGAGCVNGPGIQSVECGANSNTAGTETTAVGADTDATANNATAIGQQAQATAIDATALGENSIASGAQSTAIGQGAIADFTDSTAVGQNTDVGSSAATAVGADANAGAFASVSIGAQSDATGAGSVAVGGDAQATGTDSIAIGNVTVASATDTTAVGDSADAIVNESSAFGSNAQALAIRSVAIGSFATANGDDSTTLGRNADTSVAAAKGIAIGSGASSTAEDAITIGAGSDATNTDAIALGGDGTDANTLGAQATGLQSIAIGADAMATATNSTAIGESATASGTDSIAMGEFSMASGDSSIAIGDGTDATGSDSIAIGEFAQAFATSGGDIAIGDGATTAALAIDAVAIGDSANASADSAISIGDNSDATGIQSVALGDDANATADLAIAIGRGADATGAASIAIGGDGGDEDLSGAQATGIDSVAIGPDAVSGFDGAIVIGNGVIATEPDQIILGAEDVFTILGNGDVGLGTVAPSAPLHVSRSDDSAKIVVEETNATQGPRTLFEIKNKGNPEFRMTNTGNDNSWSFSAGLRFVVKNDAGDWVSRITSTGDMEITGELTTTGGICGLGGCDLVFHPDTNIESIEEHASQMWAKSYLPSVGPTLENAPINLSKKTGGMLNELEKAHIYIEQLHIRNLSLEQQAEQMELRVHELEQQNQRIEELVLQMVLGKAETVAMD